MSAERWMMRHGKILISRGVTAPRTRERAAKKATPYRRHVVIYKNALVTITQHATKGRVFRDYANA